MKSYFSKSLKNIIPVAIPSGLTGRRGDRDPFLALILGEPL